MIRLIDQGLLKVVYKPDSGLSYSVQLCKEMGQDLLASRELAWQLIVQDISAQHRQSFFGILWAVILLITAVVFGL